MNSPRNGTETDKEYKLQIYEIPGTNKEFRFFKSHFGQKEGGKIALR
jgi:hypothetical protein